MVYVWGCNGYGRMGLGTGLQNDVLVPKFVPQVRIFLIGYSTMEEELELIPMGTTVVVCGAE